MANLGNTFDVHEFSVGRARKVWRETRHRYPGGGLVSNVADWVDAKVIPAGTPAVFDMEAKTIKAFTKNEITEAETFADLGANGYIQEDLPIKDGKTIGSATVVYDGELYGYMLDADVLAAINAAGGIAQVTIVY
jgi:hypothetical protein